METPVQLQIRLEKVRIWKKKTRDKETLDETRKRLNRQRKGKIIFNDPDIPGDIMWSMSPQDSTSGASSDMDEMTSSCSLEAVA